MKKKAKRFLALLFSVSMVFSTLQPSALAAGINGSEQSVTAEEVTEEKEANVSVETPADDNQKAEEAKPAEEPVAQPESVNNESNVNDEEDKASDAETTQPETPTVITVEEEQIPITINVSDMDVTVDPSAALTPEVEGEVDTDSPVVSVVEEELGSIKVLNDDGESVALTEEQIQTILGLYQQYLDQWKANANLLGVQTPFFLQFNDNGEDGLGALGEMLVLAGYTVEDVRNGNYKYDDLIGMIQNFYYADKFGLEFYSNAIAEKRDEVIKLVEDSGAETDVQKILVINDWLAHIDTFDMSYIMNMGEEEPIMVAEEPQKHEHYDEIYDEMYDLYYEQIEQQFHDQIYDSIKAQLRQQYYEGAIKNIVMEDYKSQVRQGVYDQCIENGQTEEEAEAAADAYMEENADDISEDASAYADQYMEENADDISEDAPGFVEANFGPEVAAELSAGADDFIEEAETEGVEVDPENAPGYKMTIEDLTQQTMENEAIVDLDGDGENETTANDAIPIYAKQAATGLTNGIIGAWEGNHIGVLAEGTSVCAGYAKAFAYLLQYMTPEFYGVNGEGTDMSVSENWKTAEDLYYDEEGVLDITQDYNVDLVRITFDAEVSMFGQVNENFNSDHFWNAVKVNGTWYYVDPCYTDVYTEVMSRDRVELDGSMNHLYFMFSHDTAMEMYDGNMAVDEEGNQIGIKTLYAEAANDTSYEESWYSRIASNAYTDGTYFYYLYDSTDTLDMMREFNEMNNSDSQNEEDFDSSMMQEMRNPEYKIVRHAITDTDIVEGKDGDSDYEALIEFNHKVNEEDEDDDTTVARVYNPATGAMEENELLTELFAQYKDECDIYPSIKLTTALYNGKLYFNLSNCILSYDLETGEVTLIKEYNTVYGQRDKTVAFGGMAFSVVDSAAEADFTVENHPIASMTIKGDGQMYVSIATNFGYISGKADDTDPASEGYGYVFEESNYNPDYSSYFDSSDFADSEEGQTEGLDQFFDNQDNDNDEFMWSAVFVDTLDMGHLTGNSHTYETVTVDPFCGRDGFTEERCTECGAIKTGTRSVDEGSAIDDHHFLHLDELYYTKDEDTNERISGECYVCTICGFAISDPGEEPSKFDEETDEEFAERQEEYEEEKAIYEAAAASAGHTYEAIGEDRVTWHEDGSATISAGEMVCEPCEGKPLDVLMDALNEANSETSFTLETDTTLTDVTTEVTGTCDKGLTTTYTATGTTEDGKKIGASRSETGEAGEHDLVYEDNFDGTHTVTCSKCSYTAVEEHDFNDKGICTGCEATEPVTIEVPVIKSVYSTVQDSVKVTWGAVEGADGYQLYRATSIDAPDDEWTCIKTIGSDTQNSPVKNFTNDEGDIQYRNGDLVIGQTYYYKVRAYAINGKGGRLYTYFSDIDYMPAAVVFNNPYSNSTERIRLLWNEVDGSHGYQIWRMNDDGTYSIVKTLGDKDNTLTDNQGATTAYSNTGLNSGDTYTYKMRAFMLAQTGTDENGEPVYKKVFGAYSDEFTVAVMPEAPASVKAESTRVGRATVEWSEVNGAAGYQVWMAESEDGTYSIVKSITDGSTSYTKYDLESGSTYYFKVRAYTEVDGKKTFGAYSDPVSATVN